MSQVQSIYEQVSKAMRAASIGELRSLLAESSDSEIAGELENSWPVDCECPAAADIATAVALVRGEVQASALDDARKLLASLRSQATQQVYEEPDDARYFAGSRIKDYEIRLRILIERAAIRRVVTDILATQAEDGPAYTISVYDGEDTPVRHSRDVNEIMSHIGACDEEHLIVRRAPAEGSTSRPHFGNIFLVYGNDGWDVICDYHTSLDSVLTGANRFAEDISSAL